MEENKDFNIFSFHNDFSSRNYKRDYIRSCNPVSVETAVKALKIHEFNNEIYLCEFLKNTYIPENYWDEIIDSVTSIEKKTVESLLEAQEKHKDLDISEDEKLLVIQQNEIESLKGEIESLKANEIEIHKGAEKSVERGALIFAISSYILGYITHGLIDWIF